jgi:hypothetical protein
MNPSVILRAVKSIGLEVGHDFWARPRLPLRPRAVAGEPGLRQWTGRGTLDHVSLPRLTWSSPSFDRMIHTL